MQQAQENGYSPVNQTQQMADECQIKIIEYNEPISKPNVMLDLNEKQQHMLNEIYRLKIIQIVKIQSHIRTRKQKQKYKVMRKMAKQRQGCLFYDLLKTEENFVQNLELINNNLITIVQQNNLLLEQDQKDYFQNWQQILRLNKQMLADLQQQLANYHPNIRISNTFKKYISFFKIYYDYYASYNADRKLEIRQKNQQFNELITKLENSPVFNNSLIESYLIIPSQRLPRYELILKDLVRNTPEDHPDYSNIKGCLNEVKIVIGNINEQMQSNQYNQMLFELQRKIFDPIKMVIVETTRRLILAETVSTLIKGKKKNVTLYLCNDLIILTKRIQGEEQFHLQFELINIVEISRDCAGMVKISQLYQRLRFWCQDVKQSQNLIFQICKTLKFKQQSSVRNQQIDVEVLGSAKQINMMKKYTEYYLNITFQQKEFLCTTRHRILCQIEELMRKKFPSIMSTLFREQNCTKDNLKNLEIKQRCIFVKQFFQKILNSHELKNCQDKSILELIGLPYSFYNDSVEWVESIDLIKMIRGLYADNLQIKGAYTYNVQYQNQRQFDPQDQLIDLEVINNLNQITYMDRVLNLKFETKMNLENLRSEISKIIELQKFQDFRFYLLHKKKKIFLSNLSLGEVLLIKNAMKNNLQKILKKENKSLKLAFRKTFFVNLQTEQFEYSQDYVRLSLLCHQIFHDYQNDQYLQDNSNFKIIAYSFVIKYCDFYLMNTDGKTFTFLGVKQNIDQFIPEQIYKEKKDILWVIYIRSEIIKIQQLISFQLEKISNIVVDAKTFFESSKIFDLKSKMIELEQPRFKNLDLKTKLIYLAMQNFLTNEHQNRLFGSSIYDIKFSKESQKLYKIAFDKSIESSNKMALKYDRFFILAKCEILIQVTLTEIIDIVFEKNKFIFSIGQKPGRYKIKIDQIDQFKYQIQKYLKLQSKVQ